MLRLLPPALLMATSAVAWAHLGFENTTEVRIFSNEMRVVCRTSFPFAWSLLGDQAPAMADESGRAIAKPLLAAAAPGLFTLSAGGKPFSPVSTDCVFEVKDDVAFVLTYERPVDWPVVMEASFIKRMNPLDSGTISVYDYTASRFSRDLEPIAEKLVAQGDASISFSPDAPPVKQPAAAPTLLVQPLIEQAVPARISRFVVAGGLLGILLAWLIVSRRPRD